MQNLEFSEIIVFAITELTMQLIQVKSHCWQTAFSLEVWQVFTNKHKELYVESSCCCAVHKGIKGVLNYQYVLQRWGRESELIVPCIGKACSCK